MRTVYVGFVGNLEGEGDCTGDFDLEALTFLQATQKTLEISLEPPNGTHKYYVRDIQFKAQVSGGKLISTASPYVQLERAGIAPAIVPGAAPPPSLGSPFPKAPSGATGPVAQPGSPFPKAPEGAAGSVAQPGSPFPKP